MASPPSTEKPSQPSLPTIALRLLRLTLPRIPLLLKTALLHTLSLNDAAQTSDKWGLRAALVVRFLRSITGGTDASVTRMQRFSLRDGGVPKSVGILPGSMRKVVGAGGAVKAAVEGMGEGAEGVGAEERDVEVEWTVRMPKGGEKMEGKDGFARLMEEVKSEVTVLYLHGGAYYLMDPASHRELAARLAYETQGRACSVRYRLAPQHPFPAALVDALVAYLGLLYPGPEDVHEAVRPECVVLAGDSAGGGLSCALVLLVLHLRRQAEGIELRLASGAVVRSNEIPLPGGVAANSPWVDLTRSLPSQRRNAKFDYLPPSWVALNPVDTPPHQPVQPNMPPPCALWPRPPPRADLYCKGELLTHPLVSPLAAETEAWRGTPPIWICVGEEMGADEGKLLAKKVWEAGGKVRLEMYEAMPHVFCQLLRWLKVADRCVRGWTGWARGAAEGRVEEGAVWIGIEGTEVDVEWEKVIELDHDEARRLMENEKQRRVRYWKELVGHEKT